MTEPGRWSSTDRRPHCVAITGAEHERRDPDRTGRPHGEAVRASGERGHGTARTLGHDRRLGRARRCSGSCCTVGLGDVTAAGQSSFLPAHSQSTQVASLLKSKFHGGENVPLFVLFDRPSGLTAERSGRDRADRHTAAAAGPRRSHAGVRPADDRGQGSAAPRARIGLVRRSGGDHRARDQRGASQRGHRFGRSDPQAPAHRHAGRARRLHHRAGRTRRRPGEDRRQGRQRRCWS